MTTYVVVQHSSGPSGGYVVRECHDGYLPQPYTNAVRLREYKRRHAAQSCADRMNERETCCS